MRYLIQKKSGKSAYLQLYTQIRNDIVGGIYPYGTKLPSKRLIAEECGVSTITVEHAYALLCDEGYAEARQRSGYFVIFRSIDGFVSTVDTSSMPITHIESNDEISVQFPFSTLAKTMRSVITTYGEEICQRSENQGSFILRHSITQYLQRSRGIQANPGQIIIGSGSEYLYGMAIELLGRDRTYAIETPSYHRIEEIYRAAGADPIKLPLGAEGIETGSLKACQANVLHITPYRSFPSGVTASASKRHEYLSWAAANQRIIIEDDYESEFCVSTKPVETLFSQSTHDNIIYMNSFSKTISPSLRIGYMVLPESLTDNFQAKLGFHSCTVPTYMQYVLAELINNGDFERHINRVRRLKRKQIQK